MSPFNDITIDQSSGQKGLTLIELLVVLGIMAILLAIAIPRMDMLQTSRLNGAARVVWSDMHHAKMTAIKENRSISVVFDGDGYSFETLNSTFNRNIVADYNGVSISSNQSPITFSSRARGNSGTITLALTHDNTKQKKFTIFNGRVGRIE